jgi:hypothetical protein
MRIGRGNWSTRRKHAPVPLCPPQIPHDLTWARTRTAAVESRRLTVWAMARPIAMLILLIRNFMKIRQHLPCYMDDWSWIQTARRKNLAFLSNIRKCWQWELK